MHPFLTAQTPTSLCSTAGRRRARLTWIYLHLKAQLHDIKQLDSFFVTLASSSESEDGGIPSPPRKKQRLSPPNMQTNGYLPQQNGESDNFASTSHFNGSTTANGVMHGDGDRAGPSRNMSETDKDIVRLIGEILMWHLLLQFLHNFVNKKNGDQKMIHCQAFYY